ncbi:sigma E regulatory protein, MucB/RseB [Solimonas aquatica]|uniref:Sigma E regulatory protein, MucB/RseB n=1 Tax=Solimonas aquatica TaxID=489703 RepID=A0A1H9M6Q2_9GAMM|nr:outer membrane lipoprotein-sorting protein [Solimonas aquatica]SER19147.1 sigma E regulatory protein, MucB/RseB [Solimonas aquatica]
MIRLLSLSCLLLAFAGNCQAIENAPDALQLMQRSAATVKLRGARMNMVFELRNASGNLRKREVETLIRTQSDSGESSRRALYLLPAEVRGLASLLIEHQGRDDELWVYLPAAKRLRRLLADGKRDSFMGTVLSNADVLGHKPEDWHHNIVGEDEYEGHKCWRVVSLPRGDAVIQNSGYSRRESWIDQQTAFNWRMDTWDEQGQALKRIENHRVQAISQQPGAFQAYEVSAQQLQDQASSRILVQDFVFLPQLKAEAFAPNALQQDE